MEKDEKKASSMMDKYTRFFSNYKKVHLALRHKPIMKNRNLLLIFFTNINLDVYKQKAGRN